MQEITERLLTERIAQMQATLASQQAMIVALVYELGKGKRVTISKGNQRQADEKIGELEARRMSSGEIRFTPYPPEEVPDRG